MIKATANDFRSAAGNAAEGEPLVGDPLNSFSTEDRLLLERKQAELDAKRRQQVVALPRKAPISQVVPNVPIKRQPVRTFEWICERCKGRFKAARCREFCDRCLELITAENIQKRRLTLHTLAMAPAGEDFLHVSFEHPQLSKWVTPASQLKLARGRAMLDYNEERKHWCRMLLLGGTGAGKTTLGCAVYRAHADRVLEPNATDADEEYVRRMFWVSASDLARARKEARLGETVPKIERALNATLLFLDDLGQEPPDLKDDLLHVLSERQRHRRKTIVTYGYSLEDLAARYGDHAERRLTERAHVIELLGKKQKGGARG